MKRSKRIFSIGARKGKVNLSVKFVIYTAGAIGYAINYEQREMLER